MSRIIVEDLSCRAKKFFTSPTTLFLLIFIGPIAISYLILLTLTDYTRKNENTSFTSSSIILLTFLVIGAMAGAYISVTVWITTISVTILLVLTLLIFFILLLRAFKRYYKKPLSFMKGKRPLTSLFKFG